MIDTAALATELAKPAYAGLLATVQAALAPFPLSSPSADDAAVADGLAKQAAAVAALDALAAAVNAVTVDGPKQDVPVADVEGFLSVNGVLTAIEDWLEANTAPSLARMAGKELLRTIASPHVSVFVMSDAGTYAALSAMLGALAAEGVALLSADQIAALLAMAATSMPAWQQFSHREIDHADVLATAGHDWAWLTVPNKAEAV